MKLVKCDGFVKYFFNNFLEFKRYITCCIDVCICLLSTFWCEDDGCDGYADGGYGEYADDGCANVDDDCADDCWRANVDDDCADECDRRDGYPDEYADDVACADDEYADECDGYGYGYG